MKPLTQIGAQHFVSNFGADVSVNGYSVNDFLATLPKGGSVFSEGTQGFDQLKDCLLREAERSLLLSGNCYARALDGLRGCSAYWSVVGLYYAAFFSLKAILGMHGCWMGRPNRWVEVDNANPGNQKIVYKTTIYPNSGGVKGSHKVTWVAFYEAMNHLTAWLTSPHALLAIQPVNHNKTWMIDTRNEVNYDPLVAFQMMSDFQSTFNPTTLPTCFGGKLQTMVQIAQAFIIFSKETALNHGLRTDICVPANTRKDWCQQHMTAPQHPALIAFATSEYPRLEY
jgi:hypothetical protein